MQTRQSCRLAPPGPIGQPLLPSAELPLQHRQPMGARRSDHKCQSPGRPAGHACRLARRALLSPPQYSGGATGARDVLEGTRDRVALGAARREATTEAGVAAHPMGPRCGIEDTRVAVNKGTGLTSSRTLEPTTCCVPGPAAQGPGRLGCKRRESGRGLGDLQRHGNFV